MARWAFQKKNINKKYIEPRKIIWRGHLVQNREDKVRQGEKC